jgi:aminomuconate-semialdehyde/2-hydroxymuconate-6-semialdehyde dehydrogenase
MQHLHHFIGGQSVPSSNGRWLDVEEPATGEVYAKVADGDASDIEHAVQAASRAFPAWADTDVATRAGMLDRLATLLEDRLDQFAIAESKDSGKPIAVARSIDIPRSAANLRYFAHAVQHAASECHDFDGGGVPGATRALNYTLRSPRGVAGCISPWNLPLYLFTWKIAPALATGNTVVAKPSEVTPLTAMMLGELATEAGLPPGVLNIVHGRGSEAGAALVTHPKVPAVTFTGSTGVGRWIANHAGHLLKRVSLELGGKNPFIIFDDADLDVAIATAMQAAFRNQGQICLCGSRLLVHESVAARVRDGIVAGAKALAVGDPSDPATRFGAIVSREHLAKIESMVSKAKALGGRILTGGERVAASSLSPRCRDGSFFAPTVIEGLDPACEIEQEEIFGPVVTLQTFRDEAEALRLANGTNYGLAATVFTRDSSRAQRVSRGLQMGIVWVNCWMVRDLRTPFGGAKQSGVGREGGSDAIRFFTEPKNVCIAW